MRWALLLACLAAPVAATEFRVLEGHGGPVMGVDISADGRWALSASFDNAVGLWDLSQDAPPVWLDGHEAAVKTVHFLGNGLAASAGDDYAIEVWDLETGARRFRLTGHKGPVADLDAHGGLLASASWDGSIGLWDLESGTHLRWLTGHRSNVADVELHREGAALLSASYDGTIRDWDLTTDTERVVVRHGFGVNTLILNEAADWLAYGAVDGGTRVLRLGTGETLADLTLDRRPILAMAASPDMSRLAVGDGEGYIMVVDTADWSILRDFHAAKEGPVWALAFTGDGTGVLAGGIDDRAYLWPIETTEDLPQMAPEKRAFHTAPETVGNGERQFLRKCSVCHALEEDNRRRAGPNLAGLFGRKAGDRADYTYSEAVSRSNVIWTEETIDQLFDLGPDAFIPGTKMPVQRINDPADRRDLIEFLREETRR